MTNRRSTQPNWPLIGLALTLLTPTTATIDKYFGLTGVCVYVILAAGGLWLGCRYAVPAFLARVSRPQVLGLTILTFAALWVIFVIGYPLANGGKFGAGSDSDEALNIATAELLQGRYPYYERTYLGNPISPLPGALLLAVPFVWLGNSAYQNLFWLLIFWLTAAIYLQHPGKALLLVWAILLFSPEVLRSLVTGSDYIANSLYVLLFTLGFITSTQPSWSGWLRRLGFAVLLGVGLAARANFLLLLPVIFTGHGKRMGWQSASIFITVTLLVFCGVTLPFYWYDPAGFSPLHTYHKLAQFEGFLPHAGLLIPAINGLVALLLALTQCFHLTAPIFLRNCALILAVPVILGTVLNALIFGEVDLQFVSFGLFFLFFGALAAWTSLGADSQRKGQPVSSTVLATRASAAGAPPCS